VRSVAIYGGVGKQPQAEAVRRGAEVVVACPGRLLDLIQERRIDLSRVEVLVLDEADRMCDMGFLPDVRRVLKYVPAQRQTLFFSATMPADIRSLADTILHRPTTIQIGELAPVKTVSHALYPVADGLKTQLALAMLTELEMHRVLIFTRTKSRARRLALNLEKAGHRVSALQGNMSQNKRQQAIDGFRSGAYDILVATDIASRGIDVDDVTHVINFDLPNESESYVHRIGRTARAGAEGIAYSFCDVDERKYLRDIEKLIDLRVPVVEEHPFADRVTQPTYNGGSKSKGNGSGNGNGSNRSSRNGNGNGSRRNRSRSRSS
jgi:ATP-dependent RNA helicase RhlE